MFENLDKNKNRENQKVTKEGEVKSTRGRKSKNRDHLHIMVDKLNIKPSTPCSDKL